MNQAKRIVTKAQLSKVERFTYFAIYCYVPWWLKASIPTSAPKNDMTLIENLKSYDIVDDIIANSTLNAMNRHMWYLSEELVPLSLFSESISDEVKRKISKKISSCSCSVSYSKRIGESFGKPFLPIIPKVLPQDLSFFAGQDSLWFFRILDIDSSFLDVPVRYWCNNDAYLEAKEIISRLGVVNDAAERGV